VLEVVRHTGSGQMHGFVELKLKDIRFGHFSDRRFKQADRVDEVALAKRQMEYIYSDNDACYFMDPQTFDQVAVPRSAVGRTESLLKEGSRITVELLGEEPVSVQFPKVVELSVLSTGPGIRDGQDSTMKPATLETIKQGEMVKGDVLAVAQMAGIMAAKQTSHLIPLCHPLPITNVSVEFKLDDERPAVDITATVKTTAQTGVEMEALTAVSVAALTIYDMCKAVDRGMHIESIRLARKSGGKSGEIVLE
jgi:cyclic pyranopterin phosphate synthase